MTNEWIDITDYVKNIEMIMNTGLRLPTPEATETGTFMWKFETAVKSEINFTVEPEDITKLMELECQKVMKMEQKGKYWFDVHFTADVIMTDLQTAQDGTITATYMGMNISDLTNRSPLSRFLRWLFSIPRLIANR